MIAPEQRATTIEQQLMDALELHSRAWNTRDGRAFRIALRTIIRLTKRLGYTQRMVEERRARLLHLESPAYPWDDEDTPTVTTEVVKG